MSTENTPTPSQTFMAAALGAVDRLLETGQCNRCTFAPLSLAAKVAGAVSRSLQQLSLKEDFTQDDVISACISSSMSTHPSTVLVNLPEYKLLAEYK